MKKNYSEDLSYTRAMIEEVLENGKYFKGETCHNCGKKYNLLNDVKDLDCVCGAYMKFDRWNEHLPFLMPDFGPPASLINFASSDYDQVPYSS